MIDEQKWIRVWEERHAFEATPDNRPKKFITAAFPYPNSPQHIGHARTYTVTDAYARYWRLRGYNVLFPMGFHVTGTPVFAMAKRIKNRDPEIIRIFRDIYGIPEEDIQRLDDPVRLVLYFSREIEQGMKEMGFSIDWRRKFYTMDKEFNAFVQWQFRRLNEKGYLKKGEYYVAWCPSCKTVIGGHDTKGDVDPEIEEMAIILFEGDYIYPVATYRPETVFGVTNIWINPEATYVVVEDNGRQYIYAKQAYEKLRYQGLGGHVVKEIRGKELLQKKARSPFGDEVPILPADFVDPKTGTGVVMSVPAHAPYDYDALKKLGFPVQPKKIIETPGYGDNPAAEALERAGGDLEKATKELYKAEYHNGRMLVEKYRGQAVSKIKEKIVEDMGDYAKKIWVLANAPVICRCGTECVVKRVDDQWFIDYGNPEWKEAARQCLSSMGIIPEETREKYEYTIDWLREKPCTRDRGLGTPFPFDESKVIEPLSDSTIYMAFYTVAHRVKGRQLNDAFFNYVMLGKGEPQEDWEELRREFLYWYPLDSRHSGADLIHNHLTFFIFNHTAVFPKELWPKQIVTNGFVLMEGKKMSKSLGNILPLRKAIREYGADTVRLSVLSGADLMSDTNFSPSVAKGIKERLRMFLGLTERDGEEKPIDKWLLSRFYRRIAEYHKQFEAFKFREIIQSLFYEFAAEIAYYFKRGGQGHCLKEILEQWAVYMSPFIPFTCEEIWSKLGHEDLVSTARFPEVLPKIDDEIEQQEEIVRRVRDDIQNLKRFLKGNFRKVRVIYVNEEFLKTATDYFSREVGMPVEAVSVDETDDPRKEKAKPGKPAISFVA